LQQRYPGKSRLFLLDDSIAVRAVHINLVYALLEFYQQNQLRIVGRSPVCFRIEPHGEDKPRSNN
ncbi:hypothetical protein H6F89_33255, partial [Cyanobacteria bacterium FACHB-63]|nr:hypothetical protein [Cyanobacteria bacterium FACHB-63]